MLADVEAVLMMADGQLAEITAMCEASLKAKTASPALQATIKNFLENDRSSLEYLAHALYDRFGTGGPDARIYWPCTDDVKKVQQTFDRNLPGVRFTAGYLR